MENGSNKHNNRCIHKAADNEPLFVLRAQDASAREVIKYWLSINPQISAEHHIDAMNVIKEMDAWPHKKIAD